MLKKILLTSLILLAAASLLLVGCKKKEEAAGKMKVLLEPFEVGGFLRVGFYQTDDGAVVELMEYLGDETEWFPDSK